MLERLTLEIANLQSKEIVVSEHALVRYFERVKQFDLEVVKKELLPEKVKEQIAVLGDGRYPVDSFKIVIKNNTVVSVI